MSDDNNFDNIPEFADLGKDKEPKEKGKNDKEKGEGKDFFSRMMENKTSRNITFGVTGVLVLVFFSNTLFDNDRKILTDDSKIPMEKVRLNGADYDTMTLDKMNATIMEMNRRLKETQNDLDNAKTSLSNKTVNVSQIQALERQMDGLQRTKSVDEKRLRAEINAIKKENKMLAEDFKSQADATKQGAFGTSAVPTIESPRFSGKASENNKTGIQPASERKFDLKIRDINDDGETVLDLELQAKAEGLAKGIKDNLGNLSGLTGDDAKPYIDGRADDNKVFLPAGSILSGTLISGADLPTSGNAKKDPFPILMRVKHEAILPNNFSLDIKECFMIGSGYGDLSSERGYIRAEVISCISENGDAFESSIDAFATGTDGKAGVKGRLVTRNGALIARSMIAGVFGGLSESLTPTSIPQIQTDGNSEVSFQTPSMQNVFSAGAFNGASSALDRIANYYIEMAESIYPIVEINAGRKVDFIVKRGISISFK